MQRNRRGFKGDEIRSIINRVASCCIAFQCCRQIYRNTIRVSSLLSSVAVAIIMTTRNDAFVDFIGICYEKVSSLLLRTTTADSDRRGSRAGPDQTLFPVRFTKNVQDAPPLAVGRNERSWGWARCPRQDAVESVLGFQVLKAPPQAAG